MLLSHLWAWSQPCIEDYLGRHLPSHSNLLFTVDLLRSQTMHQCLTKLSEIPMPPENSFSDFSGRQATCYGVGIHAPPLVLAAKQLHKLVLNCLHRLWLPHIHRPVGYPGHIFPPAISIHQWDLPSITAFNTATLGWTAPHAFRVTYFHTFQGSQDPERLIRTPPVLDLVSPTLLSFPTCT